MDDNKRKWSDKRLSPTQELPILQYLDEAVAHDEIYDVQEAMWGPHVDGERPATNKIIVDVCGKVAYTRDVGDGLMLEEMIADGLHDDEPKGPLAERCWLCHKRATKRHAVVKLDNSFAHVSSSSFDYVCALGYGCRRDGLA